VTTKLELVKPAHAPLSPSKAHRWLVCPGSQLVSSDDPETEWAATGHHKHEVLRLIMRGEPVVAGDVVEGREVELETIEQCVEIKEYVAQWRTHHPDWEVREEVQLEVGAPTWGLPPDECRGTGDVVGWGWDEMLVLDAKFGWVQVEARGNAQLYLYALGALAQSLYPVKSVCLIIAQPDYSGEVVFKEERTTPERLYQWALENQGAMEEARSGSRRLQADDTACRYCPARTYCPARLKALEDFNSDEWMQAHKLEDLLPYLPRIEAIVRDLKAKAVERLAEGQPLPGWKLVESKSKRRWKDEADHSTMVQAAQIALGQVNKLGALKVADFMDTKLKSPAKVEKLLKKHLPKGVVSEFVEAWAFKPTGRPKLAPASDERPALEGAQFTLEDVLKFSAEDLADGDA
jgi:hypothetical protein